MDPAKPSTSNDSSDQPDGQSHVVKNDDSSELLLDGQSHVVMNPPDVSEGPYNGTAVCVVLQILTVLLSWNSAVRVAIAYKQEGPFSITWAKGFRTTVASLGINLQDIMVTKEPDVYCNQNDLELPPPGTVVVSRRHRGDKKTLVWDLSSVLDLTRELLRDRLFNTSVFLSHDWASWPDRSGLYYLRECLMRLGSKQPMILT